MLKTGDPNGKYYMPAMSDAPLRGNGGHDWFWEPEREQIIYPLDNLVEMYYNSVGHNTSLILGVTPNSDGMMPEPDVARLREFGEEIERRFKSPVATGSGAGNTIDLKLNQEQMVNQLVIMEDISKGERVREFKIEGKTAQGWITIFEGSCIGHKFIHRFDEVHVSAVRLKIMESKGEPSIKEFSIYRID
jgi:alpha-L-fucosidase